jgi:hypothetical protein
MVISVVLRPLRYDAGVGAAIFTSSLQPSGQSSIGERTPLLAARRFAFRDHQRIGVLAQAVKRWM